MTAMDPSRDYRPAVPVVREIQRRVSGAFGVSMTDLLGRRRTQRFVQPRQVAMYICAKCTGESLAAIGRLFGKDHTTVIHAIEKVEEQRKKSAGLDEMIDELMADLWSPESVVVSRAEAAIDELSKLAITRFRAAVRRDPIGAIARLAKAFEAEPTARKETVHASAAPVSGRIA